MGRGTGHRPPRTHLWNVLALTEQRRRRAQATFGPGSLPRSGPQFFIGRRPTRVRLPLASRRVNLAYPRPPLPGASLVGSARLLLTPVSFPSLPPLCPSQMPSRSRDSLCSAVSLGAQAIWRLPSPPAGRGRAIPRRCLASGHAGP